MVDLKLYCVLMAYVATGILGWAWANYCIFSENYRENTYEKVCKIVCLIFSFLLGPVFILPAALGFKLKNIPLKFGFRFK